MCHSSAAAALPRLSAAASPPAAGVRKPVKSANPLAIDGRQRAQIPRLELSRSARETSVDEHGASHRDAQEQQAPAHPDAEDI